MKRSGSRRIVWKSRMAAAALGFVLLGVGGVNVRAQDNTSLHTAGRTELDIVKVLLAQEKAWNAGDIDEYAKGYKHSPDTLFIGRQISRGYTQMLEDYKRNYPTRASMGTLTFSELEVHSLERYVRRMRGAIPSGPAQEGGRHSGWIFSLVFEKTDQGWRIVMDHTT